MKIILTTNVLDIFAGAGGVLLGIVLPSFKAKLITYAVDVLFADPPYQDFWLLSENTFDGENI